MYSVSSYGKARQLTVREVAHQSEQIVCPSHRPRTADEIGGEEHVRRTSWAVKVGGELITCPGRPLHCSPGDRNEFALVYCHDCMSWSLRDAVILKIPSLCAAIEIQEPAGVVVRVPTASGGIRGVFNLGPADSFNMITRHFLSIFGVGEWQLDTPSHCHASRSFSLWVAAAKDTCFSDHLRLEVGKSVVSK